MAQDMQKLMDQFVEKKIPLICTFVNLETGRAYVVDLNEPDPAAEQIRKEVAASISSGYPVAISVEDDQGASGSEMQLVSIQFDYKTGQREQAAPAEEDTKGLNGSTIIAP